MPDEANTDQKTAKRYEILVPSPLVRLNLGQSDATKLTGPFGYTGVSLHADDNLFIHIAKDTLYQSPKNYNGQVVGTWAQYADGGMVASSAADQNLSAGSKILLVAGAGQTSWLAVNHGSAPGLVAYNSLDLHYRVEEIQNGLFEFFFGRQQRMAQDSALLNKFLGAKKVFNRANSTPLATDKSIESGFVNMAKASLRELFPDEADAAKHPDLLLQDLADTKVIGKKDASALKYGFSGVFSSFDPYGLKDPAKGKNPLDIKLIALKNAATYLKRLGDVVGRYGSLVTDNAITKSGLKLAGAVDNTLGLFSALTTFPQSIFGPIVLSFPDEWASGGAVHVAGLKNASDAGADFNAAKAASLKAAKADDTRQAYVTSRSGPFNFSKLGLSTTISVSSDANTAGVSITLQLLTGVSFTPAFGSVPAGSTATLSISVDGTAYTVPVTLASIRSVQNLVDLITPVVSSKANVSGGSSVTIASKTSGASSSVTISVSIPSSTSTLTAAQATTFFGIPATGLSVQGTANQVGDPTSVKADAILAAFGTVTGFALAVNGGAIQATSNTKGPGSSVTMNGPKAMLTAGYSIDYDWAADSTSVSETIAAKRLVFDNSLETDDTRASRAAASAFSIWWANMEALPSDIKNFARPLMAEVATVNKLVGAAQKFAAVFNPEEWKKFLDDPSSPIGIIAASGIALGTPDKLVGVGGKGVLFVADGGTGGADWKKFVVGEETLKRMLEWRPSFLKAAPDAVDATKPIRPPSMGFRVLSDSYADVSSTLLAQVMALGRAKLAENGEVSGIGVARLGASYAAEVVAHNKVVISARKKGTEVAKTQGRVELAAQTIAIGGTKLADDQGKLNDFQGTDLGSFGIRPPKLLSAQYVGAQKRSDSGEYEQVDGSELFESLAWSKKLSEEHPNTDHVQVHATKDAIIVVGPYLIKVESDKGLTLGTRKESVDPTKNEYDDQKPAIFVTDKKLMLELKKDGASVLVQDDKIWMASKKDGAGVTLDDGKVFVLPDGSGSTTKITVTKDKIMLKSGEGNTATIDANGIAAKGSMVKWG